MNDLIDQIKTPQNITKEDIKQYICPLADDKEIFVFINLCKMFELNPFKREIYLVKYNSGQPASTLVGYETYLKRAERSQNWNGFEVSSEGRVSDDSLKAIVKLWRKDWEHPLVHEVHYSEYVQYGKDKTGAKYINRFWKEKPITMIKKVAVSQAFRLAFPDEFSGMPYTREEYNDVEYTETPKIESKKPELEMPTPKSTATMPQNSAETRLDSTNAKKEGVATGKAKTEPIKQEAVGIISQAEWDRIVGIAKKNGWTESDIVNYVKDLGYKASKKHTPLNTWDAEDFEYFFSVKKANYVKTQAELEKVDA